MRRLNPISALAMTALVLLTAGCNSPVSRSGDYELTFTTGKAAYAAGEPIDATARLAYSGVRDHMTLGTLLGGPIGFGLRQIDGPIHIEPGFMAMCDTTELAPGQPLVQQFRFSGGWSNGDPNAAFYRSMSEDPQLRLPAGRWELFATVDGGPSGADCEGQIELRASTEIAVTPSNWPLSSVIPATPEHEELTVDTAKSLALAYYGHAHPLGAQLSDVTVRSSYPIKDTDTGRHTYRVEISGNVTKQGTSSGSYISVLVLSVDADTGEVRVVAPAATPPATSLPAR